jgi:hypothetical protein
MTFHLGAVILEVITLCTRSLTMGVNRNKSTKANANTAEF